MSEADVLARADGIRGHDARSNAAIESGSGLPITTRVSTGDAEVRALPRAVPQPPQKSAIIQTPQRALSASLPLEQASTGRLSRPWVHGARWVLPLRGARLDLSGSDWIGDQTIYAWRLADVRRVLDLAASLPGLRRVDLVTNYRCPRTVVERAVRLIGINSERFAKAIRAGPAAEGALLLGADGGDELARARRLLTDWLPAAPGVHAVLARTNAELAPFAAVALEARIPYRAADDGLLLDDPGLDEMLEGLPSNEPPAHQLSRRASRNVLARSLVAWSLGCQSVDALRSAIAAARERRAELRRDDAQLILATAHGTKGLEFDHVAVIGLDDGVFPSRRTLEEADDPVRALEEERRLAYVAWTRAKKSLLLVYDPAAPSVFMREAFSAAELG